MTFTESGLVVLCGPSGSGKSTFAARHFAATQIISSDQLRGMVSDDEADQGASGAAFFLLRSLVRFRLSRGRLTVVDSTALQRKSRRDLLRLARESGAETLAVVFDVDFETCVTRNATRERQVPDVVLLAQFRLFEQARLSIAGEGFDRVITVRATLNPPQEVISAGATGSAVASRLTPD
jgi:protein phosphatase